MVYGISIYGFRGCRYISSSTLLESPAAAKLQVVKNWLLWAVAEAEVALGSGTGPLKLQYVYDLFIGKFPWAIHLISFEMFKEMVDEALDEMRDLLAKNEDVAAIVEAPVEPVGTE